MSEALTSQSRIPSRLEAEERDWKTDLLDVVKILELHVLNLDVLIVFGGHLVKSEAGFKAWSMMIVLEGSGSWKG
jgi:hypothetical protein